MPTVACPECKEEVFVDAETEQGDVVFCDECGADLEVVGLDPFELDSFDDAKYDFEDDDLDDDDEY
jgi:alpha-aminoadipate/glutamate carrier protein LysW